MKQSEIRKSQMRRKYHVRKKIYGTSERPRLSVFRSSRHIYVQIIDDSAGVTLASASTRATGIRGEISGASGNVSAAEAIGTAIAKEAISVGINCVVFDRNRYRYHGRIKALADAARKSGLVF
jgi:large subunit ribosomal protein L18